MPLAVLPAQSQVLPGARRRHCPRVPHTPEAPQHQPLRTEHGQRGGQDQSHGPAVLEPRTQTSQDQTVRPAGAACGEKTRVLGTEGASARPSLGEAGGGRRVGRSQPLWGALPALEGCGWRRSVLPNTPEPAGRPAALSDAMRPAVRELGWRRCFLVPGERLRRPGRERSPFPCGDKSRGRG